MIVTVVLLTTKQLQIYLNKKKGGGFNGIIIQSHGLCVSATVLYQLSYKDSYIGRRPVYWVQFIYVIRVLNQLLNVMDQISLGQPL